ncbi:hypothetical protein BDZ91DRAFT_761317 [Kalaharituber pfeilii]|nr:hypothetical protein BDZ91DRAFT_761317 [Kalaharituber pfeilii]
MTRWRNETEKDLREWTEKMSQDYWIWKGIQESEERQDNLEKELEVRLQITEEEIKHTIVDQLAKEREKIIKDLLSGDRLKDHKGGWAKQILDNMNHQNDKIYSLERIQSGQLNAMRGLNEKMNEMLDVVEKLTQKRQHFPEWPEELEADTNKNSDLGELAQEQTDTITQGQTDTDAQKQQNDSPKKPTIPKRTRGAEPETKTKRPHGASRSASTPPPDEESDIDQHDAG